MLNIKDRNASNLNNNLSNVLFVLCTEVGGDLDQDWRFVFYLQGVTLL